MSSSAAAPPAAAVLTLISSEGHEFVIDRRCALISGTIRRMLEGAGEARFSEGITNEVTFSEIRAVVLEKVCQYLYYNFKWSHGGIASAKDSVPPFDIEPEMLLELLMAANFLEC